MKYPLYFNGKHSLNAEQGKHVNEIEATLMLMAAYFDAKRRQGKKGVVLNRGTKSEIRVKYGAAARTCQRLMNYFGEKGCLSFGICKTCGNLNTAGHTPPDWGKCKHDSKTHHIYDTCSNHTKEGGGFGL